MLTKQMTANAHKVAYLIQEYPDHTLTQIIALLQLPAIDINTAIWAAIELKLVAEPDPETDAIELLEVPKKWDFGPEQKELETMMIYSFTELAKKEQDLEENYLSNWTAGHPSHNVIITLKKLLKERKIAQYELTDPKDTDSVYTFFTLYEYGEQLWGRKQFVTEPVGDEKTTNTQEEEENGQKETV